MILFFYANDQSNNFNKILNNIMNIIQLDHNRYSLKEDQGKLKFYINDIGNIKNALEIINKVINNHSV
jgi:mannitol/fructose-specific phosphotransferase system IIA component (Ntr-type)